jgi:aspartate racemase
MKTLGLIGGTTWVSTTDYYRLINKEINQKLGGHHSARLILCSINFHDVVALQDNNDFHGVEGLLKDAATSLASAGAEGIMICANTLHKYADAVIKASGLPLIHIADETAMEIRKAGYRRVGLLGTKPTMNEPFYREKLATYGIDALVPGNDDQWFIHRAIFDELGKDIFRNETRIKLLRIMNDLGQQGAEAIILGCTEIPLIIKPEHTELPLFDTLQIHARAAARFILKI